MDYHRNLTLHRLSTGEWKAEIWPLWDFGIPFPGGLGPVGISAGPAAKTPLR
jgi:hypothetical protein